jgi:hypothetical protein
MNPSGSFPTFCHISEYGKEGYQALHRMLAMSQPLNLWAPSSAYLRSASKLSVEDFLKYVQDGFIRVLGREEWLLDPVFRDHHPWEGARWDRQVDGSLKRICLEDQHKPQVERRVVVAPPEQGWKWAKSYLKENPDQVKRWHRVVFGKTPHARIPAGTLETARRQGEDSFRVAQAVFRDAYNHGQALSLSQARVSFLLARADEKFLKILAEAPPFKFSASATSAQQQDELPDPQIVDLSMQLLEVLRHMDLHAKNRFEPGSLDKFVRGSGRQQLLSWFNSLCERLQRTDAQTVDNEIMAELRHGVDQIKFEMPFRYLVNHPLASLIGAVGLITSVVGVLTNPGGPVAMASILSDVFPVGAGLCRQLGFVPSTFTGMQWPFLYTFGSRATKQQLGELAYVLSEFRPAR